MTENDIITCSICLEEIFPVHKILHTTCSHTYHISCLEKYIISLKSNNRSLTCPICRSNISNEPYMTPPHSPISVVITISTNTRPQTVRHLRSNRQCHLTPCQKYFLLAGLIILLVGITLTAFLIPVYVL